MTKNDWDAVWLNANIVTCENKITPIRNGAIAVRDGKIACIGNSADLSRELSPTTQVYDVQGRWLTPGFIDCHTHVIYAGSRAKEFALRLEGVSYEEIAKRGGGIFSTVKTTREASFDDLLISSLQRVSSLQRSGVTTIEIKSGYGLDWETEKKILCVADEIAKRLPITVVKTFLGAHTIPPEFKNNRQAYVNLLCHEMIPMIAKEKLAEAIDVFSETIAFNLQETASIFMAAQENQLRIKCHAEQLSNSGSAILAAQYGAISVDHLEYLSTKDVEMLAKYRNTVAVLLPGAFYFLREKKLPPIHLLRENKIPIAIASDCNPGTSPIMSLRTIMNMGAVLFNLTTQELLLAVTQHAAKALNREHQYGTLIPGKVADLAIWNVNSLEEIFYYLGNDPLHQLIKEGKLIQHS